MFVSLLSLIYIISETSRANREAATVTAELSTLKQQETQLKQQAVAMREALAPGQRQLLDAAHVLIDRKQFSWSRLFVDLESVLPGNVRVARINVRDVYLRNGETYALLEMTVVSRNSTDVTNMLAEMDRGGTFQAEPVAQNLQKGSNSDAGGMEWVLSVIYRPRSGTPVNADEPPSLASATSTGLTDGGQ